jgi:hypothetical protein
MTLPQAAAQRQLKHRRQIDVQVYVRGNGLWEVDAMLVDVRTRAAHPARDERAPGAPIHEMRLRLPANPSRSAAAMPCAATGRWCVNTTHAGTGRRRPLSPTL